MGNKRFNKGLVTLLAAGAIAITSVLSGCNDTYRRIDNLNLDCSYEDKQIFKEEYRTFDIKKTAKELGIDFNEIKRLNKEQRKKLAIEFNKEIYKVDIMDPNNVSNRDLIFMYNIGSLIAEGAMMQNN